MPFRLREATIADVSGMTRVGLDAFEHDEINIAMFPHGPDPSPDRHRADRARFRTWKILERMLQPGGVTMVAVDEERDGRVAGYAHWTKPAPPEGVASDPPQITKDEVASASLEFEKKPPSFAAEKLDDFLVAQKAEEKRVFGEEGSANVWYLIFLAVDPEYQGRGVGRLLLQWGIDIAKAQGKGLYLSATPAGKPFYSRLGLEDVGAFEIFGTPQTSFVLRS